MAVKNPRLMALGGIFILLGAIFLWQWISGWGLVTLNVRNAPLGKVLSKIEWQGGVKIATNAPLDTPVTIKVHRVTPYAALDKLSDQLDANVNLAYLAAPSAKQIKDVLLAFSTNDKDAPEWAVFGGGGRFGGGADIAEQYDIVIDPRTAKWAVSDMPDKNLQSLFSQGSQKTGALFAMPKDWNPTLARFPKDGKVKDVAKSAAKSAHGTLEEIFLLRASQRDRGPRDDQQNASNDAPRPWMGGGGVLSPRFNRNGMNADWMSEQVQNQINNLPPDVRADAKQRYDDFRKLFASLRDLPEDQRRAKFEELMNDPKVQEAMDNRQASQDAKNTPEKRENRMRHYVQRKLQMKSQSQ